MLMENRNTKRNLGIALIVVLIVFGCGGYLVAGWFAKAQTPPLSPEERLIPAEVISYYESKVGEQFDQLAKDYEPIQKRMDKASPYQQEIFVLAANKLGIDPKEWGQYMIDYKKKALVKRPQQPQAQQAR